jgi:hypothetical protein
MEMQTYAVFMMAAGREYRFSIWVSYQSNILTFSSEWAQRVKESDGLIKKVKA